MKAKRTLILLIVLVLTGSLLSGCGGTAAPTPTTQAPTAAPVQSDPAVSIDGKVLIVYFAVAENSDVDAVSSASVLMDNNEAKGMSKFIADIIAERTGGELFSIQTEEKFPGEYNPLADRAKEQQDKGELPALISHIENLDDYDVVFIGYPIWWYTLPQVMFSFFEEYDFSGKTIIPFCTHFGSRDGGTFRTITELEPDATVLDGIAVNQRDVAGCEKDVLNWLEGLGY